MVPVVHYSKDDGHLCGGLDLWGRIWYALEKEGEGSIIILVHPENETMALPLADSGQTTPTNR